MFGPVFYEENSKKILDFVTLFSWGRAEGAFACAGERQLLRKTDI